MRRQHLGELGANGQTRVQRCGWLLVDHSHLRASHLPELSRARPGHITALEENASTDNTPLLAQVAHARKRQGRFATAGFSHQTNALAGRNAQGHIDNSRHYAGARPVGDAEVLDGQERLLTGSCGSRHT